MAASVPSPSNWQNPIIEKLVDSIKIDEVRLSPSGDKVAYTVKRFGHERDREISSLWLADVGVAGSARQLTSDHNDFSIQWSPDEKILAFLSDRGEGTFGFYGIQVSEIWEKSNNNVRVQKLHEDDAWENMSQFFFSPDGKRIAFLAKDLKDEAEKSRAKAGDDVEVYGKWDYNRVYLLNIYTLETTKIYSKDKHVNSLAWSTDGSKLLLVLHHTPELDSPFQYHSGISFETLAVDGAPDYETTFLTHFPGPIQWDPPIWAWDGDIFFTAGATPTGTNSSLTVYRLYPQRQTGLWSWSPWSKYSHGEVDCCVSLRYHHEEIYGQIQAGLTDEIRRLGPGEEKLYSDEEEEGREDLLYSDEEQINDWDIKDVKGCYVLAISKSNTLSPTELYTVKVSQWGDSQSDDSINDKTNSKLLLHAANLTKITSHNQALADAFDLDITSKVIACKSDDGTTDLDAIFIAPTMSTPKPLPTCVFIHGGAYDRTTFAFNPHSNYHNWQALLLSLSIPSSNPSYNAQPIAFLSPNYRGGSGRGEKFASWTHHGVGTVEYDDIISLVSEGISLGLVDPDRIVVGGWSQGGILSYLLTTRRNLEAAAGDWKIRGSICGAGGTALDMLAMSSDKPFMQGEGIGGPPWDRERDDMIAENASAILRLRKKGAAESMGRVLIFHGKEDQRLPVSQAEAFRQACEDLGVGDKVEMAVYPRQGHMIGERAHLIDMLERIERFCSRLLS